MKLWVVFLWEPYEIPVYHRYFKSEDVANIYLQSVYDKNHFTNKYWEIEGIETED